MIITHQLQERVRSGRRRHRGQEQTFRVSESTLTPCNESRIFEVSRVILNAHRQEVEPCSAESVSPSFCWPAPYSSSPSSAHNPRRHPTHHCAAAESRERRLAFGRAQGARSYGTPSRPCNSSASSRNMTVIELQPGGGWYTEILAPVLYAHGHLLEASDPKFADKIKANPAVFGHIGKIIRSTHQAGAIRRREFCRHGAQLPQRA